MLEVESPIAILAMIINTILIAILAYLVISELILPGIRHAIQKEMIKNILLANAVSILVN